MAEKITLYRCDPLRARILPEACERNKKRRPDDNLINRPELGFISDMPCRGCAGLGEPTTVLIGGFPKKPLTRTIGGLYV